MTASRTGPLWPGPFRRPSPRDPSRRGPFLLSPATQAGYAEMVLRGRIDSARAAADRGDRGASVVEWVIISALVVGIAVAVGAILLNRLRNKANSIDFDSPGAGGGGGNGGGGVP